MIDFLIGPWTWGDWMWRGTLAASLVAVTCAPLGVFLYLRRMSMLTDALSHVALTGIVAMYLLGGGLGPIPMLLGAGMAGWFAALAIEGLANVRGVKNDAAIGIVFTTLFALGVIGVSAFADGAHIDLDCVLFGNVLGVSDSTLKMLTFVSPLVWLGVLVGFRGLALASFDPVFARSIGVPVAAIQVALMSGVSFASVASFEAAGAILVIAFFIVPAAIAHVLCDRLKAMVAVSVGVSLFAVISGMYASVALNCSSAGAMVVVLGMVYALVIIFAPKHGLLAERLRVHDRRTTAEGHHLPPVPAE